jgi:LmbE family N-acetylglucosaminyl deacetylase
MSYGDLTALERLTEPNGHRFLSPHYDDVPLSCGGTVARLTAAGERCEVIVLNGGEPDRLRPLSRFAEATHEQWGLPPEAVITARRHEEATAIGILGARSSHLPFLDAIYRGDRYADNDQLFGAPAADEAGVPAAMVAALTAERSASGVRFYAPLAVGDHVDHRHAFVAGRRLAASGGDIWFYDDLPYSLKPGAVDDRIHALAADCPMEVAAVVDVTEQWRAKLTAILAYPSQLTMAFGFVGTGSSEVEINQALANYAERIGQGRRAERFWRLTTRRGATTDH